VDLIDGYVGFDGWGRLSDAATWQNCSDLWPFLFAQAKLPHTLATPTLSYIFVDESGKPEIFSSRGINLIETGHATRYLVLAAVRTESQLLLQQKITDFKSALLKDAMLRKRFSSTYTLDAFHAHHDYDEVKEKFYSFIVSLPIKIDVIVVEKLKCYPQLQQNPGRLYGVMAGQLLKTICHHANATEIIFSRKDSKLKLRQELELEVERVRLEYFQQRPSIDSNFKLKYHHNPHYSHGGLQIADYVAYAVFQLFERANPRWYSLIRNKVGRVQDICNKKYFTRNNPPQLSN
jgi:hypothetical protein